MTCGSIFLFVTNLGLWSSVLLWIFDFSSKTYLKALISIMIDNGFGTLIICAKYLITIPGMVFGSYWQAFRLRTMWLTTVNFIQQSDCIKRYPDVSQTLFWVIFLCVYKSGACVCIRMCICACMCGHMCSCKCLCARGSPRFITGIFLDRYSTSFFLCGCCDLHNLGWVFLGQWGMKK